LRESRVLGGKDILFRKAGPQSFELIWVDHIGTPMDS
jgi:hypothetical protein